MSLQGMDPRPYLEICTKILTNALYMKMILNGYENDTIYMIMKMILNGLNCNYISINTANGSKLPTDIVVYDHLI